MELKELVGKRILIKETSSKSGVIEATLEEVSPSGEFVKLNRRMGIDQWRRAASIVVEEVLN